MSNIDSYFFFFFVSTIPSQSYYSTRDNKTNTGFSIKAQQVTANVCFSQAQKPLRHVVRPPAQFCSKVPPSIHPIFQAILFSDPQTHPHPPRLPFLRSIDSIHRSVTQEPTWSGNSPSSPRSPRTGCLLRRRCPCGSRSICKFHTPSSSPLPLKLAMD